MVEVVSGLVVVVCDSVVVVPGSVVVGAVVVEPGVVEPGVVLEGVALVPAGQSTPLLMHFVTSASSTG